MRRVEVHGPLTIDVRERKEDPQVPPWLVLVLVAIAAAVVIVVVGVTAAGCGSVWIDLTPDGEDGEELVDGDAGDESAEDLDGDGEQLVDVEDLADGDAGDELAEDLDAGAGEDLAAEDLADDDAGDGTCGAWWWADLDGDGFGAGVPLWVPCGTPAPSGYVANGDDCCDAEPNAYPGQPECFFVMPSCEPLGFYRCDWNCDSVRTNCDGGGCQ